MGTSTTNKGDKQALRQLLLVTVGWLVLIFGSSLLLLLFLPE